MNERLWSTGGREESIQSRFTSLSLSFSPPPSLCLSVPAAAAAASGKQQHPGGGSLAGAPSHHAHAKLKREGKRLTLSVPSSPRWLVKNRPSCEVRRVVITGLQSRSAPECISGKNLSLSLTLSLSSPRSLSSLPAAVCNAALSCARLRSGDHFCSALCLSNSDSTPLDVSPSLPARSLSSRHTSLIFFFKSLFLEERKLFADV